MRMRVRFVDLQTGGIDPVIPSLPDTVIELPDEPVAEQAAFDGKLMWRIAGVDYVIEWGFKGLVGSLQRKLMEDKALTSASDWSFVDTDRYDSGVRLLRDNASAALKCRMGVMVER